MAPKKLDQPASSELGDGDWNVTYNPKTGRPTRTRRKTKDLDYVDTTAALSDLSDSDDGYGDIIAVSHKRKRKTRTPSPPPEPSGDDAAGNASDSDEGGYASDEIAVGKPSARPAFISRDSSSEHGSSASALSFIIKDLVVNVPKNHVGAIILQLEVPGLGHEVQRELSVVRPPVTKSSAIKPSTKRARQTKLAPSATTPSRVGQPSFSEDTKFAGFLDLPAELRNDIYERVFVDAKPFSFQRPTNFQHSAAFLRTCHQVHEEAVGFLYSQNKFIFERRTARHGSYWEADWNEAGFKPLRKFLKNIGARNLGLIKRISLTLEDAMPSINPSLVTVDDRRFVNDDTLMSCLRHLGRHGKLREIELHFYGRRRVEQSDARLLGHLQDIKAEEVKFVRCPMSGWVSKQSHAVEDLLLRRMVKKRKRTTI